ncbi:hypothetical protein C8R43DRAFT_1236742 [Mycena crocata]|nr:hypothetical protein C8R43DRAFT_1236742 [Mycena crocata]
MPKRLRYLVFVLFNLHILTVFRYIPRYPNHRTIGDGSRHWGSVVKEANTEQHVQSLTAFWHPGSVYLAPVVCIPWVRQP